MAHSHSHDDGISHSHDDFGGHGHSHEILDGPGSYLNREMPLIEGRDWKDRAFTIGIGGYVRTLELVLANTNLVNAGPSGPERRLSCWRCAMPCATSITLQL